MRTTRRTVLSVLTTLLLAGVPLFAGGASEAPAAGSATGGVDYTSIEKCEIEFWGLYGDEKQQVIQKIIDDYNASQDKVKVSYVCQGDYGATDETLTAAQAAGKGLPGVAFINVPRVQTYAASGMVEPLDAYIKATNFDIDDINPGMIDAMTYSGDGKIYAMPWGISSAVLYWNMDILHKIGLDEPPKSWQELVALGPKVKEATGMKTMTLHAELNYDEVVLRNAGADPLGDGKTATVDDPHIIAFMKQYKEMIDNGYAAYYSGADSITNQRTDFYSGGTLAMMETSSIVTTVQNMSSFEVGETMPLVNQVDPAITCIAGGTIIVPAENPQNVKNAAWDFVQFMLQPKYASEWCLVGNVFPVRNSVADNAQVLKEITDKQPMLKTVYPNLNSLTPKNKSPYQTACYKLIINALSKYYAEGGDPEAIMKACDSEVQNKLDGN